MLYTPQDLSNLGNIIQKPDFLWEGVIPTKSKVVLLHGPGGVGKSAFLWSLFNAIEEGKPFLGLATKQAKTLIISTDMSVYDIYLRWDQNFTPLFHMEISLPFEVRDPRFPKTDLYKRVKDFVGLNNIELVAFDTVGKIHFGDPNQEETVGQVYNSLLRWLPNTTIIGNFHNKKAMRNSTGHEIITEDDFRGSRKWVDDAVVQLQIRKVEKSAYHSKLYHMKSQVSAKIDPIDLYINLHGLVELWQDSKSKRIITQWGDILQQNQKATPDELIKAYMAAYTVARASAYRARAMYNAARNP